MDSGCSASVHQPFRRHSYLSCVPSGARGKRSLLAGPERGRRLFRERTEIDRLALAGGMIGKFPERLELFIRRIPNAFTKLVVAFSKRCDRSVVGGLLRLAWPASRRGWETRLQLARRAIRLSEKVSSPATGGDGLTHDCLGDRRETVLLDQHQSLERGAGGPLLATFPFSDWTTGDVPIVGEDSLAGVVFFADALMSSGWRGRTEVRQTASNRRMVCLSMAQASGRSPSYSWMAAIASP